MSPAFQAGNRKPLWLWRAADEEGDVDARTVSFMWGFAYPVRSSGFIIHKAGCTGFKEGSDWIRVAFGNSPSGSCGVCLAWVGGPGRLWQPLQLLQRVHGLGGGSYGSLQQDRLESPQTCWQIRCGREKTTAFRNGVWAPDVGPLPSSLRALGSHCRL